MTYFRLLALLSTLAAAPALGAGTEDGSSAEGDLPAYEQAEAAVLAGDFASALPILTELVAIEPDNADAWNLLGFSSRKSGDLAAAEAAYARALALNPDHLGALEYQGEMFVELGQMDKAAANLARLTGLCGSCEESEDLAAVIAAGS